MSETLWYNTKVIVYGDFYEIYKYQKNILKKQKTKMITKKRTREGSRSSFSLNRTRNTVRRLVSANFTNKSTFITLTFAENMQDIAQANRRFRLFTRRLRHYIRSQGEYPVDNFKYLAVIEFQKRGAIHYHIICTLPYISQKIMHICWPYGFFKINKTRHIKNIGAYVSKYLYKESSDQRLRGAKAYFCSTNLIRPYMVINSQAVKAIANEHRRGRYEQIKKGVYKNEYTGKVYYQLYKRKFDSNK